MEKIIDEENKIEFDIQKFLNEDCAEENEVGIKSTFSILSKAWKKGVEEGFNHGWERGYKESFGTTSKMCELTIKSVTDSQNSSYNAGFKKALMMIQWYNKIFLGIDEEYDAEKIKRLYKKYKGE